MMNRGNGTQLNGMNHLIQSIRDILTTPIGTRVMRRDYGSRLFDLVDSPINNATIVDMYAATAEAIDKWEPRLRLDRVEIETATSQGQLSLILHGEYLPEGKSVSLGVAL